MSLPGRVWRLGWISFLADVSSEMAYPILPLFLRSIGAPAAAIGLIEGLADGTSNVLKGISGARSDRSGKRVRYVKWGYSLSAMGKPLIALAQSWPLVAFSRVLDRYGKGLRTTARDAMLAESAPEGQMGAVFGLHRAMDTAGAFVGVAVSLALIQFLPGQYRTIFLLAGIPGLAAVLLTLGLRDRHETVVASSKECPSHYAMPRTVKQVVLLHSIFGVANTSDAFLLLRGKEMGLSESAVIGAYLFYNIAYAGLSYPAGRLSDRVGRWPLVTIGWAVYSLTYAGFAFMGNAAVWPLFLLYGVHIALVQGVAKAQVAELAPKSMKGTVLGRFFLITGLSSLFGNLAFGVAWDQFGSRSALLFAAVLALVPLVLFLIMRPWIGADATGAGS